MIDFDYLYKGLCGLANAHRASSMAGHLGAAVVAGYFFGEDQSDLGDVVDRGIQQELDRIVKGEEAFWFNAQKAGITSEQLFEPMEAQAPQAESISTIADALAKNIGQLRQSGHNVIFAAIAIRALHDHPDYAMPAMIGGVRKLIEGFNNAVPGRGYYGTVTGWKEGQQVKLEDDGLAAHQDEQEMVNVVIDELIATAPIRKQGFGGLWHIINHAAALVELSRFGYKDLARQGLAAHHRHVRLWRSLPDVEAELGAVTRSEFDPREPDYWTKGMLKRDEARLTHRIKTLYGYFTLRRFFEDEARLKQADESLRYLMA